MAVPVTKESLEPCLIDEVGMAEQASYLKLTLTLLVAVINIVLATNPSQ